MAKCGLNAESLPFGLNVVSYHNVEAGSKKRRQELIFCMIYIYHFSIVIDFSSEKYSCSTGHRNS